MKRGDTVQTFTGRTGRVVQMLPEHRVAVSLVLYPHDGRRSPRPVRIDVIYDRADVSAQPKGA